VVGLLVRYSRAGARIPLKEGIVAGFGAIISIGSGASVGRQGPAVYIGASFASWLGQRLKLSRSLALTLLGCGVAAAVSASFNAPIAGAAVGALALISGKIAATSFSLGSGFVGGIFSPSPFIGAMTCGAFGLIAASVMPELSSSPGFYAIAGMGAVTGAVLGAPISIILIVFELTGSYEIAIVVMVATALAAVVTGQMGARSFFLLQLLGRGLDLVESRAAGLMQDIHVSQIMSRNFTSLNANAGIAEIKRILSEDHDADIVVTDDAGRLLGMVGFAEIRSGAALARNN